MKIPPSKAESETLAGFAENLPIAFMIMDINHKILSLNAKARNLLGVSKKDMDLNLDEFIRAEDTDALSSSFSKLKSRIEVEIPLIRLQSRKKKKSQVFRMICKRPTKTFSFIYAFLLDPSPPSPLNGILPVTDRLLDLIIENTHDIMILFNEDFKIEFASKKFFKQSGFKKNEILNQDFRSILPPDLSSSLIDINLLRRSNNPVPESYQIEIVGKGGKKAIVDINAKFANCPIIGQMTAIHFLDITEYETTIKSLEEKERWYRLLVEAMNEGFAICDEKDLVIFVNEAYCKMLGYSEKELVGQPWFVYSPDIVEEQAKQRLIDRMNGKSERYHASFVRKDGSILYTIISAAPYFDADGEFKGSFAVVTDITDLKEFQDTTQFYLDLLTHDIANQLQIILTASGMLDSDIPPSLIPDVQKNIMDAVQLCNRLITKVKRASQIRDIPMEVIDLTQILNEKIAVVKRIFGATIHMKKQTEPIYVNADMLFGELIWNLLENAASHNPKKDKHIWVSFKRKSAMIGISIADNGPGISPSKKKVIFDKKRRFGGVGLTLVSQIAKKYGGRLEVENRIADRPDLGTKFTLWLYEIKP